MRTNIVHRRTSCLSVTFGVALLLWFVWTPAAHPETVKEQPARKPFTLVALPDTQSYTAYNPQLFTVQTEWIAKSRDYYNIVFVVHEGDITNGNSDAQWQIANRAMSVLDGVVPYALTTGNHDMGDVGEANNRETLFEKYFSYKRYEGKPWYGGHMGDMSDNNYCFFSAAGMDFIVLGLEWGPRDSTLAWAARVLEQHRDKRAIIFTHAYMYDDDTRLGPEDRWNPHGKSAAGNPLYLTGGNDGEDIWEKLVKHHPNVFLVLSGHVTNDGTGRLTSTGVHGNPVHQVVANYQDEVKGGWLRLMTFHPDENRIQFKTYSPVRKQFRADVENEFELHYDMRGRRGDAGPE